MTAQAPAQAPASDNISYTSTSSATSSNTTASDTTATTNSEATLGVTAAAAGGSGGVDNPAFVAAAGEGDLFTAAPLDAVMTEQQPPQHAAGAAVVEKARVASVLFSEQDLTFSVISLN